MKATGSTTIAFGLVSVPVKLFTATASHDVEFNRLHKACGSRIKQKLHCPTCDVEVGADDLAKGYEVSKGQFVTFTAEELKALSPERFTSLEIEAFVPTDKVDYIYVEKSIFVGPDKGGDRAFNLLTKAMRQTDRVALGRYCSRGRVYVCMLRPYEKGMLLHHLFYADEVRDYSEVDIGADVAFSDKELNLAAKLIGELEAEDFEPESFKDEYRDAVVEAAQAKGQGKAVVMAPALAPKAAVVDLFEALKLSLADAEANNAKAAKAKPKAKKKTG
jgi:DNA end-binding protein Ku